MVDQPEARSASHIGSKSHVLVFFSLILATKNPYKLLHIMPHLIDTPDICLFQHKQHTQPHLQPHVLSNVWFCHSPHPAQHQHRPSGFRFRFKHAAKEYMRVFIWSVTMTMSIQTRSDGWIQSQTFTNAT